MPNFWAALIWLGASLTALGIVGLLVSRSPGSPVYGREERTLGALKERFFLSVGPVAWRFGVVFLGLGLVLAGVDALIS